VNRELEPSLARKGDFQSVTSSHLLIAGGN
jgi:hypothetical protein